MYISATMQDAPSGYKKALLAVAVVSGVGVSAGLLLHRFWLRRNKVVGPDGKTGRTELPTAVVEATEPVSRCQFCLGFTVVWPESCAIASAPFPRACVVNDP